MNASEGPAPARTGPNGDATAELHSETERSAGGRQAEPVGHAAWAAHVARQPFDVATRLVVGQLADRADRNGRVRVSVAELATCCCLRVAEVADALCRLDGRHLLNLHGAGYVLTRPARGAEAG